MDKLILVTGSEGLVGSRFLEISENRKKLHTPRLIEFDLTDKSQVKAVLSSYDFTAVVNFAAYTDVNGAEAERGKKDGLCWKVNVEGVQNLAEAVFFAKNKIHLVHVSTDMVFAGDKKEKGPFAEDSIPESDPARLTWYGYSKAEGERVMRKILRENATVLRIIYPVRAKFEPKMDYLRKPLSLYDQGKLYPIFGDQQISIAFIDEVCETVDKILHSDSNGTFHASSRDTTTPYELVSYMLEKTRGVRDVVKKSKLSEFIKSTGAPEYRYPRYGGLSIEQTEKTLGMKFSSWKEVVHKLVEQGMGNEKS